MNQIERITHMEAILDEAYKTLPPLVENLNRYLTLLPRLKELADYYQGSLWRGDFDDDCDGKLPADLKRGVLSEDAIYDILELNDEILQLLQALENCKSHEDLL